MSKYFRNFSLELEFMKMQDNLLGLVVIYFFILTPPHLMLEKMNFFLFAVYQGI